MGCAHNATAHGRGAARRLRPARPASRVGLSISLLAAGLFLAAGCQQGGAGKTPVASTADLPAYQSVSPTVLQDSGTYVHRWSGMGLPMAAGAFRRARIVKFDQAALDVSAEYHFKTALGMVLANVYVYPMSLVSPPSEANCQAEFDAVQAILVQRFPDAERVREWLEPAPDLATPHAGYAAAYDFVGDLLGSTMPVRSEVYLFCDVGPAWKVKYRITYPRNAAVEAAVKAFIAATPSPAGR